MSIDTNDPALNDLLNAAHSYFLRFGYSRVSTDEIASNSGRSKKTLYKHFSAKEELLQAVIERLNGEAEVKLKELTTTSEGIAQLKGMLEAISTNIISTQETLFQDLKEKQPELHKRMRADREQALIAILMPVLQKLSADGVVRTDIPFNEVIGLFITTVESAGDPLGIALQDPVIKRRIDLAVTLFVDGLQFGGETN